VCYRKRESERERVYVFVLERDTYMSEVVEVTTMTEYNETAGRKYRLNEEESLLL